MQINIECFFQRDYLLELQNLEVVISRLMKKNKEHLNKIIDYLTKNK